jgi:hypothetical protein
MVRYLLARGFAASAVRDAMAARGGEELDAEDEIEPGDPADVS